MIKEKIKIQNDMKEDVISSAGIPILDKFDFSQLEYSLIAFCSDIQLKLQNILPKIPIFVLQTGDETYLFRKKFENIDMKEIEMSTPRLVIKFDDFQIQAEQNSYQYVPLLYHLNNQNWTCIGRRQEVLVNVQLNFVSPNFPMSLRNLLIMSSLLSHDNSYTYEFCGNTYEAAYSNSGTGKEDISMEISSGTKNMNNSFQLDLRVPIFMPRVETIKTFDESGLLVGLRPVFNIEIKQDGITTDTSTIEGELPDDDYYEEKDNADGEQQSYKPRDGDLKIKLPVINPVMMGQHFENLSEDNT